MNELTGDQVIELRKQLNWNRSQLADCAKLSYGRIRAIEIGARPATVAESDALHGALSLALGKSGKLQDGVASVQVCAVETIEINNVMVTRSYEWRGLKMGDMCRVHGLRGLFHFRFYHVDPRQTFVEVYGPVTGRGKGRSLRCIVPERIRSAKNRPLKEK